MSKVSPTNSSLLPAVEQDIQTWQFWVESAASDPVVKTVLKTKAFKRLEDISFLGAIDYANPAGSSRRITRSRAHHSLSVAGLAKYVATERGYDEHLKRHLVLAGLLHDIGHLPLSHSAEPYFKKKAGITHHHLGEQLLRGETAFGEELTDSLKKHADVDFIIRLISGEVPDSDGGDLFSSAINIDTIDGIIRSYSVMAEEPDFINRLAVAKASFIEKNTGRYAILDTFWRLKDFVYEHIIHSKNSVLADFKARSYFEECQSNISERDLLVSEKNWRHRFEDLFHQISNKAEGPQHPLEYTKRHYFVVHTLTGDGRYELNKQKSQLPYETTSGSVFTEQCQLHFEWALKV